MTRGVTQADRMSQDAPEAMPSGCPTRIVRTQQQLGEFVVHRFQTLCARVKRSVSRTSGFVPQGFDAERWVMDALTLALAAAEDLPEDEAAHEQFVAERTKYLVSAARFLAIDDWRTNRKRLSNLDEMDDWADRLAVPDAVDPADVVIDRLDGERRLAALGVVLRVLSARDGAPGATRMTADQWATLQAYATVRRHRRSELSESVDDEALQVEQLDRQQRAREDWRKDIADHRAGATRATRDGIRVATAKALGVSAPTVTNRLTAVAQAVRFTRYVAGVLAHRGSLRHSACIGRHLDVADGWPLAGFGEQRALLVRAADAVRTTEDTGTRVDATVVAVGDLHPAESVYIAHARASSPNCVAVCAVHTQPGTQTRATEI